MNLRYVNDKRWMDKNGVDLYPYGYYKLEEIIGS